MNIHDSTEGDNPPTNTFLLVTSFSTCDVRKTVFVQSFWNVAKFIRATYKIRTLWIDPKAVAVVADWLNILPWSNLSLSGCICCNSCSPWAKRQASPRTHLKKHTNMLIYQPHLKTIWIVLIVCSVPYPPPIIKYLHNSDFGFGKGLRNAVSCEFLLKERQN